MLHPQLTTSQYCAGDQEHVSRLEPLLRARSMPRFCRLGAQVEHTEADRQSENRDQLHPSSIGGEP